jgi:hypothetical protein
MVCDEGKEKDHREQKGNVLVRLKIRLFKDGIYKKV